MIKSIIANLLTELIKKIIPNSLYKVWWIDSNMKYKNEKIRLSISYLFKIKIDDKYLLIKGNRINQFQPVGGVFKRYASSKKRLNELGVLDDKSMPIDGQSKNDLRIRVPEKNLMKFLKWYDKRESREVTVFREFYEELIKPGIISGENFPYIKAEYLGTHKEGIRHSSYYNCPEILIAEIYEVCLNQKQEEELRILMKKDCDDNILWATEEEIKRRGVSKENLNANISETSEWTI